MFEMKYSINRFVILGIISILIVCSAFIGAGTVFGKPAEKQTSDQQLKSGPWLLEYGLGGSASEWDYAFDLLVSKGIDPDDIFIPDTIPPVGLQIIRSLRLAEYINDNNLEDVRIIGHSQGGIDAAYMTELGYLLDNNIAIPDYLEISEDGILASQKQEFINAYKKVKGIYTLHSAFMRSSICYCHVADLIEEFVNYGSGRDNNECCKPPYEHSLCWFVRNPDDGLLWIENLFLYSNDKIIHKDWRDRGICHSEARLVPDYFLDIIYE